MPVALDRVETREASAVYFTSFQYDAFSHQHTIQNPVKKMSTQTPSFTRKFCAGSLIHYM